MHDQIIDRLAALGADADRVVLADPADLRRAGTRRNRRRLAAVTLAVLAVLGGTAVALRPAGQAPPPTPAGSRTAVPREPCEIHLAGCFPPEVSVYAERLPAPCPDTRHPSEAKLIGRSSGLQVFTLYVPPPPTTTRAGVTESAYRPGGAGEYLAEVRAMLARCPSVERAGPGSAPLTLRYRLVSIGELGGDESVLLSRTYQTDLGEQTFLIALVRRGDTVLAVMDYGWQGAPASRSDLDRLLSERK
ncbi:hypothetical protein GCM10009827_051050 [Dactylosporangium maewongense]|uniref:Serine/threonine protein kinase n=1 Tax=Dactylosporangium maewongense TaxID=634393 RepID=A0ABN2AWF7_9ACTN